MKRIMTLIGTIGGVIAQSGILAYMLLLISMFSVSSVGQISSVFGLIIILAIIGLVFNAISISSWNKPAEVFAKRRKRIITSIVFNFIVAGLTIIFSAAFFTFYFLDFLMALEMIGVTIVMIVDLSLEKKRVGKIEPQETTSSQPNLEEDLENRLTKLKNMHDQGLISDDEYQTLKQCYINDTVKKF